MALHIRRKTGELLGSTIDLQKGAELALKIESAGDKAKLTFVSSAPLLMQVQNVAQDPHNKSWELKLVGKNKGVAFLRVYSGVPGGNVTPQGLVQVNVNEITFAKLWENYPSGHPIQGKDAPSDQCTVKMSVALNKTGIDMTSFKGEGQRILDGKRIALRVKEMEKWLNTMPNPAISKSINITGIDWQSKISGKTGIIAFGNYWARSTNEEKTGVRTGDHIDLWNGSRITHANSSSFAAYIARGVGINEVHTGALGYSDHNKANPILFWEIK